VIQEAKGRRATSINAEVAKVSVFTIIEGECFRIDEGVAGDPGWSWRVVTAERL
jgi:hypothetical protein